MKKAKVLLAGALCGALVFSFAACGGGGNATLDGFTRAMRSLDMEKAASYCVNADSFEDTDPAMEMAVEFTDIIDGETEDVKKFCEDLLKECMRGFEYTVDSEEENADGTQKTLQLICSNYNTAQALGIFAVAIAAQASTSETGKVPLDVAEKRFDIEMDFVRDTEKTESEVSVVLVQQDGEWKLESGTLFAGVMLAAAVL